MLLTYVKCVEKKLDNANQTIYMVRGAINVEKLSQSFLWKSGLKGLIKRITINMIIL